MTSTSMSVDLGIEDHNHIDDDKTSVDSKSSQVSATKQQVGCPYCSWAKQQRYLFKHIFDYHSDIIYKLLGTSQTVNEGLKEEYLAKIYISLYSPDDEFKEFDVVPKVLYGCFGDNCHNTYEQPGRAKAHWKNSKKCHQSHIKRVKAELKKIEEDEKKNKPSDWILELSSKDLSFMIEKFRRFYYRVIHEDVPYLSSLPMNLGKTIQDKYLNYIIKEPKEFRNRVELLEAFRVYDNFLHKLRNHIKNNFTPPYDWKLPNPFDLYESYEEAGLLPVGSSYEEYAKERMEKSNLTSQREEDQATISKLELEKINLLKELKKAQEAPKPEAPKQDPPKLEPIPEIPKKEKRNSFTIPVPTPGSLVNQPIQTASFPTILSNTKVKRTPKTVS